MSTPGKIWSRFTKTRNGKELKFRIEELSQDKFEELLDLFMKYFVPDEPLHKASKVTQKAATFDEYRLSFIEMTKKKNYQMDACYLEDDSGKSQMVGGSIMVLEKKGDKSDEEDDLIDMIQSEEIKTLSKLAKLMTNTCKIFDKYDLESCYQGRGVVVCADYRGLGLAVEMIKMRSLACIERGVPITAAWMTAFGTQKAAEKVGWETICELQFKELGKQGGVEFEGGPPSAKLMVIKV